MALIGIFFSSLGIGLSGALMPGPMFSVCIAESYKKGFWAGPLIVAGHAIPEMVLAVLFSLGLNRFLNNKLVTGVVGIVGGAFLAWLAFKIFLDVKKGIKVDLGEKGEIGFGPLLAGIWSSVSNPAWILWWATIGASYIMLSLKHGIVGLVFFLAGHELADLLWYSTVSFFVSRGRGRIDDRVYQVALSCCALLVLVLAVLFIGSGLSALARAS